MAEEGRATTRVAPTRRGRNGGARRRDSSAPLRCARNDMWGTCGGGDGSPPPVFTGAGSRREDNGRGVFTRAGSSREERRGELEGEGRREWPKRDGRPLGSPLRGEGGMAEPGNEIPRLRCAALGMTCGGALVGMTCGGGDGSPQDLREDNGRGVFTRAGISREERRGELEGEGRREWPKRDGRPLGSPLRGEGGMAEPGDEIPRLRCAALGMTMWGKGMGPRPPSSRGQDLDARTTGGVSSRGQALRGKNGGESLRVKEGENGRRGTGPLGSPLRGEGGMAEPGDEIPRLRFAALGMTCGGALVGMTCGGRGWVPAPRLHGGRISTRGQGRRGGGQKAWAMNRPVM